jgi:1-acyl-sn-glycerol-3-phosphate acyltransferase
MFISTVIYAQFLLCSLLYIIVAAPFFAVTMLFTLIFRRKRHAAAVRFFILWYGRCIVRVGWFPWVKLIFDDRCESEPEAALYVFNHRSASDPFLASMISRKTISQVVNDWPMRLPVLGWFARLGSYIDIKNMSYDDVCARIKRQILEEGSNVMSFPEGTRSGNRSMNQFYSTVFRVAKEIQCPVIPAIIVGNEEIPNRKFKMKPGVVMMRRLPPIPAETVATVSHFKLKQMVHEIIRQESAAMDAELDKITGAVK